MYGTSNGRNLLRSHYCTLCMYKSNQKLFQQALMTSLICTIAAAKADYSLLKKLNVAAADEYGTMILSASQLNLYELNLLYSIYNLQISLCVMLAQIQRDDSCCR